MNDNYYILLDLDPSVKDEASILSAISKKQQAWSSERNHPTKGTIAKQNLGKIDDIKNVLLNAESRNKEAAEAKKILIAREAEKYDDLLKIKSILVDKNGEIEEEALDNLRKKAKYKKFEKEEILKVLKAKIKKKATNKHKDDGVSVLEGSIMKRMRTNLDIVGKKDLFDFLELSPTSSCSVLVSRANELYGVASRNPNKTAEITAQVALSTSCQTYFKDDKVKEQYQKSLEFEALSEINELIDVAGSDSIINPIEYEKIIKACTEKGVKIDRAEYYIHNYCAKKKWVVQEKEEKSSYEKEIQCNVCKRLNNPSANNCHNCGSPLKVECPKCAKTVNSIDKVCISCGFNVGDMPNAIPLIRNANIELSKGNLDTTLKLLSEAELYWPGNTDVGKLKTEVSKIDTKVQAFVSDIDQLLIERKFIAAQSKLKDLMAVNKSYKKIVIYEKQINEHIATAETFCKKAKLENNNGKKLDYYLSALEECTDFNDAIVGVSALPIEPPQGLKITQNRKIATLQWSAPTSNRALKYRIIRKENSKPTSASDGEILIETPNLTYDDFEIIAGKSYYYGVYSLRGNRLSNTGQTQGPITKTEDISKLVTTSGDSIISFQWNTPNLVKRVDIFKANSPIRNYGNGQKITSSSRNSLVDSNVTNDKEFFYSFYAVYEDCIGKEHISDGIMISSIPSAPPSAITDLTHSINNKRVNLQWSAPNKGEVQILKSTSKLNHSVGTLLSFSEIQKLGSLISNNSLTSAFFDIDFQGEIILTPLTIHNDNAVIGKAISLTSVEEVENLKGLISGGKLYLEWDWPVGCEIVQIKQSHDQYPDKNFNGNVRSVSFTKAQYDSNSGYVINRPSKRDYYFTVYTCSNVAGKTIFSNGINELVINSETIDIKYKVVVKKFWSKSAFIELEKPANTNIPEIMVISKLNGIPLNKSDGHCLLKTKISSSVSKIEIPYEYVSKNQYIKLFFTDDNNNKKIRLLMPKKEDLELY